MAINFEAMGPGNVEQIGAAYGASLARQADREFALRASGQAQDYSLRSAALAQQNSHFQDQQAQQHELAYAEMGNRAGMQQAAQSHQETMANLEADLNANKLNHVEQIRMQRLQAQASYIDANTGPEGSGRQFTPDMGNAMKTQIMTELNPFQVRTQRAQAQQSELARQQAMDFHAQQTATNINGVEAATGNAVRNPQFEIRDSAGALTHRLVPDGRGGLHPIDVRDTTATNSAAARAQHLETQFANIYRDEIHRLNTAKNDPLSDAATRAMTPQQIRDTALASARDITSQYRQGLEAATGQSGGPSEAGPAASQTAVNPAVPPTGPLPPPAIRAMDQPTDVPMARIRAIEAIANAITPRGDQRHLMSGGPIDATNATERDLSRRMHSIIATAGRENRTLNNREGVDYENARRALAEVNPDAARLFSLSPTPEQNAFGHSTERASQLRTLTPLLRDEAARLFNSTSMTERVMGGGAGAQVPFARHLGNEAVPLVGRMYGLLDAAAKDNRRLSAEETAAYLRQWRQLRRVNSGWADRLALHQD